MLLETAAEFLISNVAPMREDIARAKNWIVQSPGTNIRGMAEQWLREQGMEDIRQVDLHSPSCEETLLRAAKTFSLRQSFFQATWELVSAGIVYPISAVDSWEPNLGYKDRGHSGGMPLSALLTHFPGQIERPKFKAEVNADPDIFLKGINCRTLHPGISQAVEQSLDCYRRDLFMPAIAMLAAAAEGTWTECAISVAKKLEVIKLQDTLSDQYASISKIVSELRKVLEQKTAKALLESSGQTIYKVYDAEIWMTVLRERRNALHWGKAKSFIADQSETGTLLIGAPLHLGTLEAIRLAC